MIKLSEDWGYLKNDARLSACFTDYPDIKGIVHIPCFDGVYQGLSAAHCGVCSAGLGSKEKFILGTLDDQS